MYTLYMPIFICIRMYISANIHICFVANASPPPLIWSVSCSMCKFGLTTRHVYVHINIYIQISSPECVGASSASPSPSRF